MTGVVSPVAKRNLLDRTVNWGAKLLAEVPESRKLVQVVVLAKSLLGSWLHWGVRRG